MAINIVTSDGMLKVTARYLHEISGSKNFYYIRRMPGDVRQVLKATGQKVPTFVRRTTGTTNRQKALREAHRINREVEAEWAGIVSGNPVTSSVVTAGQEIFQTYHNQPYDLSDYMADRLSPKAHHQINTLETLGLPKDVKQEEIDALLQSQLSPAEWQAVQLARGKQLWTLSIIKEDYIKHKGWENNRKQRNSVEGGFQTMVTAFGDVTPDSISRLDVHQLIQSLIEGGMKTATVKRKIAVVRSAINYVSKMREVELKNPFTNPEIPNLLEDAVNRSDFRSDQLATVREKITHNLESKTANEVDGLIALMVDTGMRVGEVVGLRVEDIVLDAEVPHIQLHRNSLRRLKTKSSKRLIPLVGTSLEWAKANTESPGEGYVFGRYTDEAKGLLKNDHASAAANKRLKAWLGGDDGEATPTCHSFRHTLSTRLRNARCPKDIRDELGGWAKSISDNYGSPTDLKIKQEYLEASI